MTVSTVTAGTHGNVSLASGQVTFTPDGNYNGPATFTYQVCDNGTTNGSPDSKCATATVTVTVTEVNDPPTAADDSKTTPEDTLLTFAASQLTTNDSVGPANESSQTLTDRNSTAWGNGTVSLASGQVTFTPEANYTGPATFTYQVCDNGTANGAPDSKCATATVTVTVTEVNDAPTAAGDSKTTAEDTALTFAASDLTVNDSAGPANEIGQVLTVSSVTAGTHGTVSLASGQVTFKPEARSEGRRIGN